MLTLRVLVGLFSLRLAHGKPKHESITTSDQWLIINGTSVFWPSSTDYFYGPTSGPRDSVVRCNARHIQYDERSRALRSFGPTATATSTFTWHSSQGACRTPVDPESWDDPHTGPVTTLCDGIPRAMGPRETITHYYPGTGPCVTSTITESLTEVVYRTPKHLEPTCELDTPACIPVWSTWSSLSSSYSATHPTPSLGDAESPIRPSDCPRQTLVYPCRGCHYYVSTATVYYWPITTTNGSLCAQNGTTVSPSSNAPSSNAPSTAIVNGRTLTTPSIYVPFTSIAAWGNNRVGPAKMRGPHYTNQLISAEPDDISSVRYHHNGKYPHIGTAYPFNFAEYQPHTLGNYTLSLIPWRKYQGGSQCPSYATCTMVRDDYAPWLEIPEALTQIDTRWTNCNRMMELPVATLVALGGQDVEPTHTSHTDTRLLVKHTPTPHPRIGSPTPAVTHGS